MLNARTVAMIGSHPDDIEVGCGGTIKRFLNSGKNVYCIICSKGGKSGSPEVKMQELYTSLEKLGMKKEIVYILNLEDSMISDGPITIGVIEEVLNRVKPEIIFFTPPHDRHQDHRNVSNATLVAARNLKSSILFYETVSASVTFAPKIFVDISETVDSKLEALKCYKNLNEKTLDFISTTAKFRGHQANAEYAEGFEVNKAFYNI